MFKDIRFKVIEFLYNNKLFGVNKKCWADIVLWTLKYREWEDVGEYYKCGACMTKKEFLSQ